MVYDAKSLTGDFYYGKKIEQRVCLKFCVSNGITDTKSIIIWRIYEKFSGGGVAENYGTVGKFHKKY